MNKKPEYDLYALPKGLRKLILAGNWEKLAKENLSFPIILEHYNQLSKYLDTNIIKLDLTLFHFEKLLEKYPENDFFEFFYYFSKNSSLTFDFIKKHINSIKLEHLLENENFSKQDRSIIIDIFDQYFEFIDQSKYDEYLISRGLIFALNTASGRRRLAAAMISPLRTRLDYSGIPRRLLVVEPIGDNTEE
jgi:hypothetical protein